MTFLQNTSSNVLFSKLDGDTNNLNNIISSIWSAGVTSGGVVTDNGDGTINITNGEAILRKLSSSTSELVQFSFSGVNNLVLTNNAVNYVILSYNDGTPIISSVLSIVDFDCLSKSIICTVTRENNFLNIVNASYQNIDSNRKYRRLLLEVEPFNKTNNGGVLGSTNLNLIVSAGAYYYGLNKLSFDNFDTSVSGNDNQNVFNYYYKNSSNAWVRIVNSKIIDNLQYNSATGLTTLSNNRFKVDWVYIINNNPSRLAVVYGQFEYGSQAEAEAEPIPSDLPPSIQGVGVLLGKAIVKKSQTTITIINYTKSTFQTSPSSNHNELPDLQGGISNEYYHLNNNDYNTLTNLPATIGQVNGICPLDSTGNISTEYLPFGMAVGNVNSPLLDIPLNNSLSIKQGVGNVNFTRTTSASYIDRYGVLKSVGSGTPRFEEKGYLHEGTSRNLLQRSDAFSNAYWTKSGLTVVDNTTEVLDPSNIYYVADKITTSTTGLGSVGVNVSITASATTDYTFSCFVKQGNKTKITLNCYYTGGTEYNVYFDFVTKTFSGVPTNSTANYVEMINGWFRISYNLPRDTTGTRNAITAKIWVDRSSNTVNDYCYIFGIQLEALPFASSYIRTTNTAVTREADVLLVTELDNSPFGYKNKTVILDFDSMSKTTTNQGLFSFDSISYNVAKIPANSNTISGYYTESPVWSKTDMLFGHTYRVAYVVSGDSKTSNTVSGYIDGVLIGSTSNIAPVSIGAISNIRVGRGYYANEDLFGHISNFRVFNKALNSNEIYLA